MNESKILKEQKLMSSFVKSLKDKLNSQAYIIRTHMPYECIGVTRSLPS